jgi:hypothetical protein
MPFFDVATAIINQYVSGHTMVMFIFTIRPKVYRNIGEVQLSPAYFIIKCPGHIIALGYSGQK